MTTANYKHAMVLLNCVATRVRKRSAAASERNAQVRQTGMSEKILKIAARNQPLLFHCYIDEQMGANAE